MQSEMETWAKCTRPIDSRKIVPPSVLGASDALNLCPYLQCCALHERKSEGGVGE
jgi:hypothetical protein